MYIFFFLDPNNRPEQPEDTGKKFYNKIFYTA